MREVVNRLLDAVEARGGEADIVADLAAPLPAMMIGRLLGFDDDRWLDLQGWSERTIVLGGGPRYFTEDGMTAAMEFAQASAELYEAKQACPVDDVMSVWTTRRDRRRAARARRRHLRLPADPRRRRRDHAHRHRPHAPGPDRTARRVAGPAGRRRLDRRDRGVHPLRDADPQHVPGRDGRLRHRRQRRSAPASRSCSCTRRPTATSGTSPTPTASTCGATRTTTCRSASARTSASVRRWPGSRSGSSSRSSSARVRDFRLVPGTPIVEMPNAFVYGLKSARVAFDFAT